MLILICQQLTELSRWKSVVCDCLILVCLQDADGLSTEIESLKMDLKRQQVALQVMMMSCIVFIIVAIM